ncbi:hypothetical protein M514_07355, partial [Trichuris suis]
MAHKGRKCLKRKHGDSDDEVQDVERPLQWRGGKNDGKRVMKLIKDIPREKAYEFEDDYKGAHEFIRESCIKLHNNSNSIREMIDQWHDHVIEVFKVCPQATKEELKESQNELMTQANEIMLRLAENLNLEKAMKRLMYDMGLQSINLFYWTKEEISPEDQASKTSSVQRYAKA